MVEAIENFFLNIVGPRWCVFLCAMIPVIECRGSIPLGAVLGLPLWETALLSLLGNMFPVPFILLFIRKILSWMVNCKISLFRRFAGWLLQKAEKNRSKVEKYAFWGLTLFVGIPLPGTGAWTGSLVASVLHMDFKKAMLATFLGVLLACIIMTLGSYGIVTIFSKLFV